MTKIQQCSVHRLQTEFSIESVRKMKRIVHFEAGNEKTTNFLTPAYLLHRKRVSGLRLHYHIGIHKDMTKKGMSRHIRLHFNRTININLQRRNIFQQWGFQNYVDC